MEEDIQKIARLFEGEIVNPQEEKEDFFSKRLTAKQRRLLSNFSCLRYFVQIERLACTYGLTETLFAQAKDALAELGSFLPLDEKQRVLFAYLYVNSPDEGAAIAIAQVAEALHLSVRDLLKQINWKDICAQGLMKADLSVAAGTFRLPKQVIEAVAMVDMIFYLKVLSHLQDTGTAAEKTAVFMHLALQKENNEAGNPFPC